MARLARPSRIVLGSVSLLLMASSSPAADDGSVFGDGDRWVPSLSIRMGFGFQDVKGEVSSFNTSSPGTPFIAEPTPAEALTSAPRPPSDNEKLAISPIAGGRLEMMSPSLWPRGARLFFAGEISSVSGQKRQAAREGDPAGIEEPDSLAGDFQVSEILGLGSSVVADLKNVQYGARIGLFIPFEIGDWRLAVKPGAQYLRRGYTFDGRVIGAFRPVSTGPTREVVLLNNESLDVDAVGPSFEIEIDVARWWDTIGASIFVGGGAYRILGDHEIEFSETRVDSEGLETYRANWEGAVDPWIYEAAAGLRLRWQGLPPGWLGLGGD